jgi:hypothetical protein
MHASKARLALAMRRGGDLMYLLRNTRKCGRRIAAGLVDYFVVLAPRPAALALEETLYPNGAVYGTAIGGEARSDFK